MTVLASRLAVNLFIYICFEKANVKRRKTYFVLLLKTLKVRKQSQKTNLLAKQANLSVQLANSQSKFLCTTS